MVGLGERGRGLEGGKGRSMESWKEGGAERERGRDVEAT